MTKNEKSLIGRIVAENLAAAAVFERHGMDFCCHGHQTLGEACRAHGVAISEVEAELAALSNAPEQKYPDLSGWPVDELSRYIVKVHHTFTKKLLPQISGHFQTVVRVHGSRHPELAALQSAFAPLRQELEQHLQKEEQILFPFFEAMELARRKNKPLPNACFADISQPIAQMLAEHTSAGAILDHMHAASSGFLPPPDACNTFQLLYQELTGLAQDLHRHIAIENHLLFPKATELAGQLKK